MTGIIRFPRGSRPNKVTKPPAPATRRTANGSGSSGGSASGASGAATGRQLAIEQALAEQEEQTNQQQDFGHANATTSTSAETTDNLSPEQAQSLIQEQDGQYYNAQGEHGHGQDGEEGQEGQEPAHTNNPDPSSGKPDQEVVDSEMLELHGEEEGGTNTEQSGHINEAEMSEMVGDAVNSYTEENGARQAAAQASSNGHGSGNDHSHGIDMDLSAAAAAAAAAAAVASASHLATTGHNHNHAIDHHLDATETPDYRQPEHAVPEAQMDEAQQQPTDGVVDAQPAPEHSTEPPKDDSAPASTSTADMAHDSGYNHLVVESALAKRLSREPGLRPAQQRRPDQQLNLGRRSNVEALFAHIAGAEVAVPCKNCHKGHGPWTACVVVDGQMCGSCANCWFNASGARCSFHETKNTPMIHGRQSLGVPSPSTSVPVPVTVPSTLDPQLAAAAGTYTMGSPLSAGASVHHHFAQQHQHQHQQQHTLSPSSATPPTSSSAQQAAAAAAAAAVAVQQLSNGGHFPGVAATNGVGSNSVTFNGSPTASPLNLDLVSALLGGSRSDPSAAAGTSSDPTPLVSLVINQALAEVRNADQRGRDLMLVEIAAKQLALAIVRYGEGAAAATPTAVAGDVASSGPTAGKDDAAANKDGAASGLAE